MSSNSMRSKWNPAATVSLSNSELTALVQPVFPGASAINSVLTEGGLSNTNIRVDVSGVSAPILVRIYTREGNHSAKENAINKLVSGIVRTPRFLWQSDQNPVTGHPYAILEWAEGMRLELVSDPSDLLAVSRSIGECLAAVHSFRFEHSAFLSETLSLGEPLDLGPDGLVMYIERCLLSEPGLGRIDKSLTQELLDFVTREGHILHEWCLPSLTHADFGGSNILVKNHGGRWACTAVLDWEFAFSGAPYFDFGNLLRSPLGDSPGFADGIAQGYRDMGGTLPQEWKRIARIGDLSAWVDFLSRKDPGDALIADACRVIQKTISDGFKGTVS